MSELMASHSTGTDPAIEKDAKSRGTKSPPPNDEQTNLDKTAVAEFRLYKLELYWRDRYHWLKERGYLLRPRYHPEWVASWKGTDKSWILCEDGHVGESVNVVMSAIRISDGAQVMLKRLSNASEANDVNIGRLFSTEPLKSHPSNRCIPLLDVLDFPEEDTTFIVLPFMTHWEFPMFVTIGEAAAFFKQIFEGLEFMHSQNVAHNDVKFDNFMMDSAPLYDEPIHPVEHHMNQDYTRPVKESTRTLCPVKYYLIDFGSARQYNPEEGPPRIPVGHGGDRSVPEFATETVCDPFAVDVYRIGNVIRECFTTGDEIGDGKKRGFEFMAPLLQDMCQSNPQKRPKMSEVVSRYGQIMRNLSGWKLRSRVIPTEEPLLRRAVLFPGHWKRQFIQITRRVPAIPMS